MELHNAVGVSEVATGCRISHLVCCSLIGIILLGIVGVSAIILVNIASIHHLCCSINSYSCLCLLCEIRILSRNIRSGLLCPHCSFSFLLCATCIVIHIIIILCYSNGVSKQERSNNCQNISLHSNVF